MDTSIMESKIASPSTFPKLDSDDEDCEFYFLQPASSPYNMSTKIEEANLALYAEDIAGNMKNYKVKFKEELRNFEPDLTDDDVQSIESYNEVQVPDEIDEIGRSDDLNVELKYIMNKSNSSMLSIDEEHNPEEIIEDIEQIASDSDITPISPQTDFIIEQQVSVPIFENSSKQNNNRTENIHSNPEETKYSAQKLRVTSTFLKQVHCKKHCIESLDSNLELCIRKLQINEKLPPCPMLKLQKRNCCIENNYKNEQKLPNYSGLKSEYGLTHEQRLKKSMTTEVIKKKTQKRKEISKEFQKRKVEQNEEIFNEWLRNLKYKKQIIDPDILKKYCIPPSYLMQSTNKCDNNNNKSNRDATVQQIRNVVRPNTTNSLPNSNRNKVTKPRRPYTSQHGPSKAYIEIPPDVLSREVKLGNLVIRSVKKNGNNTLTISAVKDH